MKKIITIAAFAFFNICFATNKPLNVVLDWMPNANHAPLFVAKEKGFFKDEGLSVQLIAPSNPDDPPKWIAAGKADIAISYQPNFMLQVAHDFPLVRIGALIPTPLNGMVVLSGSSIKTAKDLKGKRIGSSNSGFSELTLQTMLNSVGLHLPDVQQVNMHYDLTLALMTGKIDVATGLSRNIEPFQVKALGKPVRIFHIEDYGMPTYSELIFVVNRQNRHDVRNVCFLRAIKRAVAFLRKHPEESWKLFIANRPELDNEANHASWVATIPLFSGEPEKLDRKKWTTFASFLGANNMLASLPPLDTYAVELNLA